LWRDTVTGPFLPWRRPAATQAVQSAPEPEAEPVPELLIEPTPTIEPTADSSATSATGA
jgi:hypothetical protein